MSTVSGTRDYGRFDELAEEFAQRYRRGERPSLEEYVDRLPEMADEIREMFPALVEVEQVQGDAPDAAILQQAAVPLLGELGDYRIVREIGRGGMGVVYEADQISLGRRVALKVLPGQVAADHKALARFRREAKAAARLHHTNIVPVFEVGRDGEIAFYAMQFIQGQALDQVIDELRRLRTPDRNPVGKEHDRYRSAGQVSHTHTPPCEAVAGPRIRELGRVAQSLLSGRLGTEGLESLGGADPAATEVAGTEPTAANANPLAEVQNPAQPFPAIAPGAGKSNSAVLPGGTAVSSVESSHRRQPYFRSVAQIGRQAAQGLAYAHSRGIIHRDIKPSNLLLDSVGVVWIADFGLAKAEEDGLTVTGDILGTLRYMAPERFRGEGDARADIYALGLTLYELLTLQPAFDSLDRLALIERIKAEEPARPRSLDGRIPRDLETIVLKAIDKDPQRRYATADAAAEDLRRFLADEPIQARQASAAERYWRWARRNPTAAALLGVLIAVPIIATVVSLIVAGRMAQLAKKARDSAVAERSLRQLADQAREEASTRERAERWEHYRSNIAEAAAAQQLQNSSTGEQALEAAPEEYRNWEWRHLHSLLDGASRVLPVPRMNFLSTHLSPDGGQVAVGNAQGEIHLFDVATGRPGPVLRGHSGDVESLEYSPVGRQLASGARDGTIRLWDPATGRQQFVLRADGMQTPLFHYRSDGKRILSRETSTRAGMNKYRLWDATTGHQLAVLGESGHTGSWGASAFRPDGKRVVTADGNVLRMHDADTGRQLKVLGPHEGAVDRIAFSPDGKRFVVNQQDSPTPVYLRDGDNGEVVAILNDQNVPLYQIAFSADGSRLATTGLGPEGNNLRLWLTGSGKLIATMPGHTNMVNSLAFSPDGKRLVSAGYDQTGRLWDGETGQKIAVLRGHTGPLFAASFSPDSTRLVSASGDHTVRLWEAGSGELISVLRGHSGMVGAPLFTPDGARLISPCADWTLRVWDMKLAERNGLLRGHTGHVCDVVFRLDGKEVASAAWDGTMRLWDPDTGRQTGLLVGNSEISAPGGFRDSHIMSAVAYSPDGQRVTTANRGLGVTLWNVASGKPEHIWPGASGQWKGDGRVAFSPDGTLVAAGSAAGPVRLWRVATGERVAELSGHEESSGDVVFSPDGATLASGGLDRTIRLWDVPSAKAVATLRGHAGRVIRVAYSHDGAQIASGSDDDTLRIWDSRAHALLSTIPIGSRVYGVAFSPDGTRLALACGDTTIRLIDVAARREVVGLRGHADAVTAVAWSPDGTRLVSASRDLTARVWDTFGPSARARGQGTVIQR
jgi:WD40 repeat protein/serine/threonine protein kinase